MLDITTDVNDLCGAVRRIFGATVDMLEKLDMIAGDIPQTTALADNAADRHITMSLAA
ncbi:MAG: hypothetical protein GDA36_07665 [Rhodobacteraceae bacterium]|nr:hypothetical protein [Paracoccaceae bacterium]